MSSEILVRARHSLHVLYTARHRLEGLQMLSSGCLTLIAPVPGSHLSNSPQRVTHQYTKGFQTEKCSAARRTPDPITTHRHMVSSGRNLSLGLCLGDTDRLFLHV